MNKGKDESLYTDQQLEWFRQREEWFGANMDPVIYGRRRSGTREFIMARREGRPDPPSNAPYGSDGRSYLDNPAMTIIGFPLGFPINPDSASPSPPLSAEFPLPAPPTDAPPLPCPAPQS